MAERLFKRFGHHYILVMMVGTRLFGSIGGLLVIYYVELALQLPAIVRTHFRICSLIVVVIGCTLTVLLALWETRTLRRVINRLRRGRFVSPEDSLAAGREAVTFVGRHHWHEAWLVPSSTLIPVLVALKVLDDAPPNVLINITLTVFMGISMALMSTFFAVEHCMQPVIRWLLERGQEIRYESLPVGKLRFRFGLCSTLIIMTTALMIGTLARQRAADIITDRQNQALAVSNLQAHSLYITCAAVVTGVVFSQVLGNSVASRVGKLVDAMENVGSGSLSQRLQPTGNDEIDTLARRFNEMVGKLELNHQTIQDLNSNLEHKVRDRTRRLEATLQELRDTQTKLTDVARRAGMAEIATGVLHNVGNVLNSINISTACLADGLRKSKIADFQEMVGQLNQQQGRLGQFLTEENRAEKLLAYMSALAGTMLAERETLQGELSRLTDKVGHVKGIISTQQHYARRIHFRERVDLIHLLNEILSMHSASLDKHDVDVQREFADLPIAFLEKANLVQVIDNLVKNAIEAMADNEGRPRVLTVQASLASENRVRIVVTDTGMGIAEENLKTIFSYGFTTKEQGNGFGLHSSALALASIGGTIAASSPGLEQGSTFQIEFPLAPETEAEKTEATNTLACSL